MFLFKEEPNPDFKHVWLYDKSGNETEWVSYKKDGTIWQRQTKIYNEKSQNIEIIQEENFDPSYNCKIVKQYDERGNNIEDIYTYPNSFFLNKRKTFQYDDLNRVIEEAQYCQNPQFKYHYGYSYDTKGNMIKKNNFDMNGNLSSTIFIEYKFDIPGNIIEKTAYKNKDIFVAKTGFKYDNQNNKIEEIIYRSQEIVDKRMLYKYDVIGNETEESVYLRFEGKERFYTYTIKQYQYFQ